MIEHVYTPHIGRDVVLRVEGSDRQVWADTFSGLYHVPPVMPVPRVVLDLGANIGLTAAHYKMLWPEARVIAIEMDAESAKLARRNAPGVEVHAHAVTGPGGWGSYNPVGRAEAFAFTHSDATGVLVESLTMRQTLLRRCGRHGANNRRDGADFVKMDIEGAEWPIMQRNDWAHLVGHLLVELHAPGFDPGMTSEGMVELACTQLRGIGFKHAEPHPPHPQAVFAWH